MSNVSVTPSRRALLAAGTLALSGCASAGKARSQSMEEQVGADLAAYVAFGEKNAGGAGDTATGAWIEARLVSAGFSTQRHTLGAAAIEGRDPVIEIGGMRLPVVAHTFGPGGGFDSIQAPLQVWGAPSIAVDSAGAIVVAHLPNQRWSSAEQPAIRQTIERAFSQDAVALVLVTHGPTRELIKLNRRLQPAPRPGPVALLAPRDWGQIAASAIAAPTAVLALRAIERTREAFNVIGRLDRGAPSTIIVSTPRSGWTTCAGERGPGIAAFLALAQQAPRRFPRHNLFFLCTSSHEFENAGNAAIIEQLAPAPEQTALWLHLGAGFAARDWHESGGQLAPLPSADPQRFLITSPHLLETARAAFTGLPGLEAPYSTEGGGAGELSNIIAAGYAAVIGLLGAHRFHHVAQDDMRCVDAMQVSDAIIRIEHLMQGSLSIYDAPPTNRIEAERDCGAPR